MDHPKVQAEGGGIKEKATERIKIKKRKKSRKLAKLSKGIIIEFEENSYRFGSKVTWTSNAVGTIQ